MDSTVVGDGRQIHTQKRRYNIAFLARENPKDKRSYSAALYYMEQALEKHCGNVDSLERVMAVWRWRWWAGRLIQEISKRVFKKNIANDRLIFVSKGQSKLAARRLGNKPYDVIIAPDSMAVIAFLKTEIPIIIPLDVTFSLQRDYYPAYSNLAKWSIQQGEEVERLAFTKARALLFSSDWAARSARKDYSIDPKKVFVSYFGANFDTAPSKESVENKRKSDECRLLFVGIGWERKGGDIAFETLLELDKLDIKASLTICGSTPPSYMTHKRMTVIPFLDKNDPQQDKQLEDMYRQTDFLILPTRADCAPNVLKEANAYGVPCITTDTGGVADIVKDGVNGYTLPLSARGAEYARIIAEIYEDDQRYTRLAQTSREEFDTRLSWDVWGASVHEVLEGVLEPAKVLV
jgi:glycosyltransferase involved in cell wall biosynthesis